ncbi:hypothetical protein [Pseudomonas sp. C27(2019)]|uniref:hypothetical protein n=1 Tax=Pseudomonas sp. C27(2019) TaxID=2604941 RepID=UPI001C498ED2|nr:hypothetical protein [Pseudomonas sp. C27(2019)]
MAVAENNAHSLRYLTRNLSDPEAGQAAFEELLLELGNSVDVYPDWHPILTNPPQDGLRGASLQNLPAYKGMDHTVLFIKGFVTCPYDEAKADQLVNNVNAVTGLQAYRLDAVLYSDNAYPVVVQAVDVVLEGDGTIRSRDALAWCVQEMVKDAHNAEVAETWWNIRTNLLGCPHGSRSSIIVNQHTGSHIRKILEAMNNSGMYGPIKEWSLNMLSKKKRDTIAKTLIMTAIANYRDARRKFDFELCGEAIKAEVRDTWDDGTELRVVVVIGDSDLVVTGCYYPENGVLETSSPKGKRSIAEKFL